MIVNLPKGDLHVHLNGAIPTNLVKELLAKIQMEFPQILILIKI